MLFAALERARVQAVFHAHERALELRLGLAELGGTDVFHEEQRALEEQRVRERHHPEGRRDLHRRPGGLPARGAHAVLQVAREHLGARELGLRHPPCSQGGPIERGVRVSGARRRVRISSFTSKTA